VGRAIFYPGVAGMREDTLKKDVYAVYRQKEGIPPMSAAY
jgi:hypothetical protein